MSLAATQDKAVLTATRIPGFPKVQPVILAESDDDSSYVDLDSDNVSDDHLSDSEYEIIDTKEVLIDEGSLLSLKESKSSVRDFLIRNEIPRKVFHSVHGFTTLYLYVHNYQRYQIRDFLWALFVPLFLNDVVRLNFSWYNRFITPKFWFVIRESEVNGWNGTLFYVAGLALVFTFAPKDICVMSVLLVSWADTAASTFGRQFGKYTMQVSKGKSLAGCLASAFTGIVCCYIFYGYVLPYAKVDKPDDLFWSSNTSRLNIHTYALVCGVAASISEAINVAGIDDNFTIPVLSSCILYGSVVLFRK